MASLETNPSMVEQGVQERPASLHGDWTVPPEPQCLERRCRRIRPRRAAGCAGGVLLDGTGGMVLDAPEAYRLIRRNKAANMDAS